MTTKQMAVAEGVKRGLSVKKAMELAGYSSKTVKGSGQNCGKNLPGIIRTAQEQFMQEYIEKVSEIGFDGKFTAQRLFQSASDKDNFNSTSAIKTHMQFMSRGLEKPTNITLNGVFVVPSVSNENDWQSKVGSYKQAIVNKSKALDAETIDDGKR